MIDLVPCRKHGIMWSEPCFVLKIENSYNTIINLVPHRKHGAMWSKFCFAWKVENARKIVQIFKLHLLTYLTI